MLVASVGLCRQNVTENLHDFWDGRTFESVSRVCRPPAARQRDRPGWQNRVRQILSGEPNESDEFRVLAAAHAEAGDFNRAIAAETKAQALYSEEERSKWGHLLEVYRSGRPFREEAASPTPHGERKNLV
jgi:hypothetical protein